MYTLEGGVVAVARLARDTTLAHRRPRLPRHTPTGAKPMTLCQPLPRAENAACRQRAADRRAGFTLLEAMVALAILGTSVAAVLALIAGGASLTERTRTRVLVTELVQARLEALLLEGGAAPRADADAQGRYEAPYEAFRWHTRVSRGPVEGTALLEAIIVGAGDSVHLATVRFR